MAVFEKVMHNFRVEFDKFEHLIVKFDTDLGSKVSKISHWHFEKLVDKEYLKK